MDNVMFGNDTSYIIEWVKDVAVVIDSTFETVLFKSFTEGAESVYGFPKRKEVREIMKSALYNEENKGRGIKETFITLFDEKYRFKGRNEFYGFEHSITFLRRLKFFLTSEKTSFLQKDDKEKVLECFDILLDSDFDGSSEIRKFADNIKEKSSYQLLELVKVISNRKVYINLKCNRTENVLSALRNLLYLLIKNETSWNETPVTRMEMLRLVQSFIENNVYLSNSLHTFSRYF